MNKKIIQDLARKSFENGLLNNTRVDIIAPKLTRGELKQYINLLKAEDRKHRVVITTSRKLDSITQEKFQSLFAGKQMTYLVDSDLLVGLKVQEVDSEYEISLDSTLEKIKRYIGETYGR